MKASSIFCIQSLGFAPAPDTRNSKCKFGLTLASALLVCSKENMRGLQTRKSKSFWKLHRAEDWRVDSQYGQADEQPYDTQKSLILTASLESGWWLFQQEGWWSWLLMPNHAIQPAVVQTEHLPLWWWWWWWWRRLCFLNWLQLVLCFLPQHSNTQTQLHWPGPDSDVNLEVWGRVRERERESIWEQPKTFMQASKQECFLLPVLTRVFQLSCCIFLCDVNPCSHKSLITDIKDTYWWYISASNKKALNLKQLMQLLTSSEAFFQSSLHKKVT